MNAPMTVPRLSRRAESLGTENAFVVLAEVNALVRQGKDIVSFCIGQPDFPTPANVQAAAVAAVHAGRHGYTPSAGVDELRAVAAADMGARRGLDIRPEDVVVGAGAKPFIAYTIASVTDHGNGDEVIYHDENDNNGADTYDFNGQFFTKTGAGLMRHIGFEQVTLMASGLSSTINVQAFGGPTTDDNLFIATGWGQDDVVIGAVQHDLDLIRGNIVVVAEPGGSDTVTLDDWQNQAGRTYDFQPLYVSADGSFGSLTHLHVAAVDAIDWPEGFCRRDIGWRALGG